MLIKRTSHQATATESYTKITHVVLLKLQSTNHTMTSSGQTTGQ